MRPLAVGERPLLQALRHPAGALRLISPAQAGSDDLGDSAVDGPSLESEAAGLLADPSVPEAAPSFDDPSFAAGFEEPLREEEPELADLRESVL
jgi:hypothetical protein